jgi:hypothetical protein
VIGYSKSMGGILNIPAAYKEELDKVTQVKILIS